MDNLQKLEKLDMITERIGCTYKEAREALELSDGDVLNAIIRLEELYEEYEDFDFEDEIDFEEEYSESNKKKIFESLKELLEKANATRVTIYDKEDKVVIDIPVTVGAIGSIFFLPATVVAVVSALIVGCSLKIIRDNGEEININEFSKENLEKIKSTIEKKVKKNNDDCCCSEFEDEQCCVNEESCCCAESCTCTEESCCCDEDTCCENETECCAESCTCTEESCCCDEDTCCENETECCAEENSEVEDFCGCNPDEEKKENE